MAKQQVIERLNAKIEAEVIKPSTGNDEKALQEMQKLINEKKQSLENKADVVKGKVVSMFNKFTKKEPVAAAEPAVEELVLKDRLVRDFVKLV